MYGSKNNLIFFIKVVLPTDRSTKAQNIRCTNERTEQNPTKQEHVAILQQKQGRNIRTGKHDILYRCSLKDLLDERQVITHSMI